MPIPNAKPLKTYVRDFVHCTRCNRLDLLKPDTWPDGTNVPCPGCGAGNALHVEPHNIELLQAPLCNTCRDASLIVIFLPDRTTTRRPPCANCQRPNATATVRLYVVRRFQHHGYTACQVIARHRQTP